LLRLAFYLELGARRMKIKSMSKTQDPRTTASWRSLVQAALQNDSKAINELVLQSQSSLFTFCFYLTKNRQLAEDLTHDSLLRALGNLKQLKNPDAFIGWVKQIARFQYLDYLKAAENARTHVDAEDASERGELRVEPGVTVEQIATLQVLHRLSEEDRAVLILSDIEEYGHAEVAEILKIPEGTVKSRLSRARVRFAEIFIGTKHLPHSSQGMRVAK
jgi:RNA polymerase sigma-70 factor (ECF subfamily)